MGVKNNIPSALCLADLGWSAFFSDQLDPSEAALRPARIATVHRSRMSAETADGPVRLLLPPKTNTTDFAVGDWVLLAADDNMLVRRLDRQSLLKRAAKGGRVPQLIAANLDTLFIVTSCNDDFNPARLERYLALANEAGTKPVIVLTKADKVKAPELDKVLDQVRKALGRHPAAYPEIVMTSSEKGDGIPVLRAIIAGLH